MAQVQLKQIVKTYPGASESTVKGVDLTIADGEFFILLGPSGCGKSTLLRCIAGLESITEGSLEIGERRVNEVAPKDRDLAMVFQSYALYPHMNVAENMGFGLKMRGVEPEQITTRVQAAAEILGLVELLERLPKQLSGGQRQRVALGRAIVREPQVLLLDEPLSNLDAKLRGDMRVELKRLHRRIKATMIYVTHDQVEAMTLGDRVAVLYGGVLQQVGRPLEVYDQPANRFVAGFLGSPPMNMLEGTVAEGGATFTTRGGTELTLPERLQGVVETGTTVVLGVRPEDLRVGEGGLSGELAVVEPLGAETILTVDSPCGTLVARVRPDAQLETGATVGLVPDAERLHLFASDDGRRIGPPPALRGD